VPEFWLGTFPIPRRAVTVAELAEIEGWDGVAFTDSQNLGGDTFAALALAANATEKLKLATGATNCVTRHPAVVASAIATIQVESRGRALLGIARGDSALAFIGRKPQPLAEFTSGLEMIQAYLRKETVECNGFPSRLEWLEGSWLPKVPMTVAATGPKVIQIAARLAERITFSVGAEPERLRNAISIARGVERDPALPPLSLGAFVNAVAHPDVNRAREMVRGRLSVYARFSTMHASVMEALPAQDREVAHQLATSYDLQSHAASGARHEAALTDDFVDRFGIVGPAEHVAERLAELTALGLDHFVIVGHGRNVPTDVLDESIRRFAREVFPALR
jgi:5,10-methylenetetrahydromethanopterin reductase